ncbi:oligosaccharide repeat unit polymerase [Mucilaginibacter gossypiicola]|uniref:Oligosaccharide repeat unit polymerase n=1 Tax=Mucilaginibacter gossypiicola TaxID=551995 RepID=A0A1H8NB13_9SPHI|nr:O-antigen polymerase [Mucilaginibacter gossypiicola]SEO26785.1 oligosaccharide repeat unit polymerase [Mucilaginibacter gossypiicola]
MNIFSIQKYRKIFRSVNIIILLFCIFNFKVTADFNFMASEILFVIYINLIFFVLASRIFQYLYEPPVFFLIFSFVYEVLKFPYYFAYDTPKSLVDFTGLLNSKHGISDYYGSSAMMLLFHMFCITLLLITYVIFRKKITPKTTEAPVFRFKNSRILLVVIIIGMLFSAISLYRITGGNLLYLLSRRSGNAEASDALKDNFLVSFIASLVLVLIPMYLSIKLLEKDKKWKRVLWIYVPGIVLLFLIAGSRGFAIYSIGTALILIFSFKKVPIRVFLPAIPAIFVGFAVLGLLRRSSDTSESKFSENFAAQQEKSSQWYYELANYQLQLRDEMVFSNLKSNDMLLGLSYLNLVFFPIPRTWIGDLKPEFIDAYVAETFWGRTDIGLPLNAMSEAYFNFGYFGIIVFFVFGLIMASITNYLTRKGSLMRQSLMITLMVYLQTWATTELVYVFEFLVFIIPLVICISEKKYLSKPKYSVSWEN